MLSKRLLSVLILGLGIAFVGLPNASADGVVCRMKGIQGLDREHAYAVGAIGKVPEAKATTTKIDECIVYIKKIKEYVFLHSNFISEDFSNRGALHDNPTKIVTNDTEN